MPVNQQDSVRQQFQNDDGSVTLDRSLAIADVQERAIGLPIGAFIDQMVSYGYPEKVIVDLINKDLSGYSFGTQYPRVTRFSPGGASEIPGFFGGSRVIQWSNPDPQLFIDPLSGIISPNEPTEFSVSTVAGPWEFEIRGAGCKLIVNPQWAAQILDAIVAKDGDQTWVKSLQLIAAGGNPADIAYAKSQGRPLPPGDTTRVMNAAESMITQALAIVFDMYGESTKTLLGITPVNANMPATINPGDFSAVPFDGNPDHFAAYVKQVGLEWVSRQDVLAALGPLLKAAIVTSGHLCGLWDIVSRAPVDPQTKLRLLKGDYFHALGAFPTMTQCLTIQMILGDRPFAVTGDPNVTNPFVAKANDYKGVPSVQGMVEVDIDFLQRLYDLYSVRVAAYAALDRQHQVIISADVDGTGMGSRFGAVLKPLMIGNEKALPQFTGPNPDWDLTKALNNGTVTKAQIVTVARYGIFEADPALKDLLVDNPAQNAINEWMAQPNGEILLNAFTGKL